MIPSIAERFLFSRIELAGGRKDGTADGSEQRPIRVPFGEADRRGGVPAEQPTEIRASGGQVSLVQTRLVVDIVVAVTLLRRLNAD